LALGQLGFIEVLVDPWSGYGPATTGFLHDWESEYPNPNVLLLGDESGDVNGAGEVIFPFLAALSQGGVPYAILVDGNYNYQALGTAEALATAAQLYGP
jgi:hypothetical protein